MSNYIAPSINPATGKTEEAEYLDDFYGPHQYGVRFADGKVYPQVQCDALLKGTPEQRHSDDT